MENYRLAKKADSDLSQTYEYGILNFGLEQAQSYLLGLYDRLQSIVENPLSGHAVDFLAPELRRIKYKVMLSFIFLIIQGF